MLICHSQSIWLLFIYIWRCKWDLEPTIYHNFVDGSNRLEDMKDTRWYVMSHVVIPLHASTTLWVMLLYHSTHLLRYESCYTTPRIYYVMSHVIPLHASTTVCGQHEDMVGCSAVSSQGCRTLLWTNLCWRALYWWRHHFPQVSGGRASDLAFDAQHEEHDWDRRYVQMDCCYWRYGMCNVYTYQYTHTHTVIDI